MNIQERNIIHNLNNLVTRNDLQNKKNRTLLYGYDCDRVTWHTYIKDGEIKTVCYGGYDNLSITEYAMVTNADYIPNKRLYPECCDFEFCKLLTERGEHLPFTVFDESREYKIYYGEIL